jgi:hypothetical protein
LVARIIIVLVTVVLAGPAVAGVTQQQVVEACRTADNGNVDQCHAAVEAFIATLASDDPGSDKALAELAYQLISLSLADPSVKDAIVDALDLLAKATSSPGLKASWSRA